MTDSDCEVYAVRYAHHDRPARDNFLGGDPHDTNMPLDYFVRALVGGYAVLHDASRQAVGDRAYSP